MGRCCNGLSGVVKDGYSTRLAPAEDRGNCGMKCCERVADDGEVSATSATKSGGFDPRKGEFLAKTGGFCVNNQKCLNHLPHIRER